MLCGQVEGQFLQMLVAMSGARRVLEIGTFTGFSALMMAAALPAEAELITLELSAECAEFARGYFARALCSGDEDALLAFFLHIPEDELFFLRDDVTSPDVIRQWTKNLDHDRAIPLVATEGRSIIGEGAIVRRQGPARNHVAEIRLSVAPSWRNQGVGTEMIRLLCEVADEAGFDAVLFELVEDSQAEAIKTAEEMGFVSVGRLEGGARDRDGHLHDLVTLAMPLGKYWSQF